MTIKGNNENYWYQNEGVKHEKVTWEVKGSTTEHKNDYANNLHETF